MVFVHCIETEGGSVSTASGLGMYDQCIAGANVLLDRQWQLQVPSRVGRAIVDTVASHWYGRGFGGFCDKRGRCRLGAVLVNG